MPIIVTGAAGFIGFHVAQRLLERGETVFGIDNLNAYYPVVLKQARLDRLRTHAGFHFRMADIADRDALFAAFADAGPITGIIHLAAQAGVRHSLVDPYAYVASNLTGFVTLLEAALHHAPGVPVVYASSSSVYGGSSGQPSAESERADRPLSLYGATKRANELIAHAYGHSRGMALTGLRFFTVYGPWGRPDMAPILFADAISRGQPMTVFNEGRMKRDFTFIDDIAPAVISALDRPPAPDANGVPHAVYNLGNNRPEALMDFIGALEAALGRPAIIRHAPMHPGDVVETAADITAAARDLGFAPKTPISIGIPAFVAWYRAVYTGLV